MAKKSNRVKAYLVYSYRDGGTAYVSRVYALPHTARAYASTLRKEGRNAFVVERTLRQKAA